MTLDRLLDAGAGGSGGGVPGGVEGGIPGGVVVDGIVGGIPAAPAPPPPPPPPPVQRIRVGSDIPAPPLVRKVAPRYPPQAVAAQLEGRVVVELKVDPGGTVEHVDVLRSTSKIFDDAAVEAAREWRYAPLVIDGATRAFTVVLTVRFELTP